MLYILGSFIRRIDRKRILTSITRSKAPPLGITIYTKDMRRIGTLVDVIGPVREPYGIIRLVDPSLEIAPHTTLYFKVRRGKFRGKRKRGLHGKG